jgi:hypothetical protein
MADYRYEDCVSQPGRENQPSDTFPDHLEELCREHEGLMVYMDLYHVLLKKYVDLVSCPFILDRLLRTVYREEPFYSHFTSDILQEIFAELRT